MTDWQPLGWLDEIARFDDTVIDAMAEHVARHGVRRGGPTYNLTGDVGHGVDENGDPLTVFGVGRQGGKARAAQRAADEIMLDDGIVNLHQRDDGSWGEL